MADRRAARLRSLFRTRNRALAREIEALERAARPAVHDPDPRGERNRQGPPGARASTTPRPAPRRPFVRVDAANLSDELFESELFGHERGAFTGAVSAKKGLLEVAEDGHRLSRRGLVAVPRGAGQVPARSPGEERSGVSRGVTTHPFRARLIVSSRRDLSALVERGRFPRRLLLPDRRRLGPASAARRAARGHPAARARVPAARGPRLRPAGAPVLEGGRGDSRCGMRGPATSASCCTSSRRRFSPRNPRRSGRGPSDRGARRAGVAALRRGRAPLDAAGAHGRLHRGDAAARRRQPVARGEAAGRVAQVPVGAREKTGRLEEAR